MLTTGKTADMFDEERAFVEEYKKLQNEYNLNEGASLDEGGMIDEESGNDTTWFHCEKKKPEMTSLPNLARVSLYSCRCSALHRS